jgi:aldehyde:ferredoxin oxidoreductase
VEYLRGGSILWVDLSSGKVWREPTSRYEKFIGGRGINTKLVYDHVTPGIKAYDEANVIVFGTGPMTGTLAPGGGRTEITSKSPMNEISMILCSATPAFAACHFAQSISFECRWP